MGRNRNYLEEQYQEAQLRINPEIQDICLIVEYPLMMYSSIQLPRKPTTLEMTSVWTNPREAAIFLDLDTEENNNKGSLFYSLSLIIEFIFQ